LYKYGFNHEYWIWIEYGEERLVEPDLGYQSSDVEWDDDSNQFEMMHHMVSDAFGQFFYDTSQDW
jgi:hypothetical protein